MSYQVTLLSFDGRYIEFTFNIIIFITLNPFYSIALKNK